MGSNSSISRNDSSYKQTIAIMQSSLSFQPLISRQSTFWPSAQELLQRHPSFEFLNPEHGSDLRKSSPLSSVMNLVATVCGGGVLTLPIAFAKAGIIPSTVLMIFSAIMTDFAMYILCSCARRTGGKSYGDVTRIAFGAKAEIGVTVMLTVFLCCVMVAFMVLVKDIWTPLIIHAVPALKTYCIDEWNVDPDTSSIPSDVFLVIFIVLSLPLLFQKDLHSLRHTCYVGFASLILLIVAISGKTYELNFVTDVGTFQKKVKWMTDDINDIIFAFPIIALSFFSIYNVLSVHSSLVDPTRVRVKFVLDSTIGICLVLFFIVGLCGYLYAYEETKDNILLNFPLDYKIVSIGRLGFGFTLMFGLPLVFLPCREALLSIPGLVWNWWNAVEEEAYSPPTPQSDHKSRKTGFTKDGHVVVNGIDFDEERPLLKRNSSILPMEKVVTIPSVITMSQLATGDFAYGSIIPNSSQTLPFSDAHLLDRNLSKGSSNDLKPDVIGISLQPSESKEAKKCVDDKMLSSQAQPGSQLETSLLLHTLSTLCLLTFGYVGAVAVPGVGIVWSVCGSSMSLIIGFFIPAVCYLKIRSRKRMNPRSVGAWSMAIFSVFASIICTSHVVSEIKLNKAR